MNAWEPWRPETWVIPDEIVEVRHEVETLGAWLLAFIGVFFIAACWVVVLVVWA